MLRRHFLMEGEPVAAAAGGAPAPSIVAPATGAGGDGGTPVSWRDSLPDDLKNAPSLQMFKDPQSLAKSWVSAQDLMGKEKTVIPGAKATDEEWAAFYQKAGRPEAADKYDFKLPDGQKMDDNFAKGFKAAAFQSGLAPKQVQNLVDFYSKASAETQAAHEASEQHKLKVELDAYTQKVGGEEKFKAHVDVARRAVNSLADEGLKMFLVDTGLGNRPEMIEHFAKLAGMMSEDKLRDGTGVSYTEDPSVIQKEIQEKEQRMFNDMGNTNRPAWVEEIRKLYERLEMSRGPK